jgi:hypothetical protein
MLGMRACPEKDAEVEAVLGMLDRGLEPRARLRLTMG